MSKELEAWKRIYCNLSPFDREVFKQEFVIVETALKDYESLKKEIKFIRESNENLDENYYDTWHACEKLKRNSDYALMFVDGVYCLVDTKNNKFDVVDNYKINNKGIIDNGTQKRLKALEIIKEKRVNVQALFYSTSCEDYNKHYTHYEDLTQEEYELLKEVL